jgi:hypothetical protein
MNFQSGVDHDVCEPIQLRIGLDEFTRSTVSRRHANASATHVRDCVLGGSEEVMNRQGSAKGRQKEGVNRQGSAKDAKGLKINSVPVFSGALGVSVAVISAPSLALLAFLWR